MTQGSRETYETISTSGAMKSCFHYVGGRQNKLDYRITQDDAGVYSAVLLRVSSRAEQGQTFEPEEEDPPTWERYAADLAAWLNGK